MFEPKKDHIRTNVPFYQKRLSSFEKIKTAVSSQRKFIVFILMSPSIKYHGHDAEFQYMLFKYVCLKIQKNPNHDGKLTIWLSVDITGSRRKIHQKCVCYSNSINATAFTISNLQITLLMLALPYIFTLLVVHVFATIRKEKEQQFSKDSIEYCLKLA